MAASDPKPPAARRDRAPALGSTLICPRGFVPSARNVQYYNEVIAACDIALWSRRGDRARFGLAEAKTRLIERLSLGYRSEARARAPCSYAVAWTIMVHFPLSILLKVRHPLPHPRTSASLFALGHPDILPPATAALPRRPRHQSWTLLASSPGPLPPLRLNPPPFVHLQSLSTMHATLVRPNAFFRNQKAE